MNHRQEAPYRIIGASHGQLPSEVGPRLREAPETTIPFSSGSQRDAQGPDDPALRNRPPGRHRPADEGVPWPISDGVVSLRPPRLGEEQVLIAGRDPEWERWLGPGEGQPRPTAVGLVGGRIVGWVDYDTDRDWLGPREVNVGYNIFGPYRRRGYATRAVRVLLGLLRDHTDHQHANLVIDVGNIASLGVARAVGAQVVQSNFDEGGRLSSLRHVVDVVDFDKASPGPDGRKEVQPRPR